MRPAEMSSAMFLRRVPCEQADRATLVIFAGTPLWLALPSLPWWLGAGAAVGLWLFLRR